MANPRIQLILELRERIAGGLSAARDKINSAVNNMQDQLDELGGQIPILGKGLGMLANPYTLIVGGVMALGAAYVKSTKMALEWREQMAEINVTAEQTSSELDKLSDKLLSVGGRNVMQLEQVPKAFGRIISAGLDVKTSLETLEPTMRAAKAGFTDIETVASAGVSTMMSSGEKATRVYDILFETVKEGNAEFKDIAQYLPKIVPLARNVGFALDETAGAYAALTTKLSAEQSTTSLQGIMRSLSDPKIVKNFNKLGVQIFDRTTGSVRPLLDIMKDVENKMDGLSDRARNIKFDSLGLDQMSTLGFATLIQDVGGLEKAIKATVNSQGALNKAYEDSKTPLDNWRIIQNKIKVAMIEIGQTALPVINAIGEKILNIIDYFKELYNESYLFREIIGLIGKAFSFFVSNFFAGFKLIGKIIGAVRDAVGWLINDVLKLNLSFSGVGDFVEKMYVKSKPYLLYIHELLSKIALIGWKIATLQWIDAKNLISNFVMPNLKELQEQVIKEAYGDNALDVGPELPKNWTAKTNKNESKTIVKTDDAATDATTIKGNSSNKNISISIGSFFKDTTVNNSANSGLTWDDVERILAEKFMGVVRSVETMG